MANPTKAPSRPSRRFPAGMLVAVVAVAAIAAGLWYFLRPGGRKPDNLYTGYVVSQNVYMTSPISGTLSSLSVRRGQRVAQGAALFQVDPTVRTAESERAQAQITAAQAVVAQQESALAQARSDLAAAQADVDRDTTQLQRMTAAEAEKAGAVAPADIDQARAALKSALARRDGAQAQLTSATAAIDSAKAQVQQAQAGLTSANSQLKDLSPVAPVSGRIDDIMFKPGESVSANTPVVSIVPDGEVKVRFYVPEGQVNGFQPGRRVAIGCDGCTTGMTATVDYVASRPEYTPPIIYSLDSRQKLVFLVEAVPSAPGKLIPGQPMDVSTSASGLPEK